MLSGNYFSHRAIVIVVCYCVHVVCAFADPFPTTPPPRLDPVVSDFNPKSGGFGTRVKITGTNLINTAAVYFNGVQAQLEFVFANTFIYADLPRLATSGQITLVTQNGSTLAVGNFEVTSHAPLIRFFTPEGSPGGAISIAFADPVQDLRSVTFNGVKADFISRFDTYYIAAVPLAATTGPITVETDLGTETSGQDFVVVSRSIQNAPTIRSFAPATAAAGQTVFIEGDNLNGAVADVFFGKVRTSSAHLGKGLLATVPTNAVSGPIVVLTTTGTATGTNDFIVATSSIPPQPPRIVGIIATAPAGLGPRPLLVRGLNFQSIKRVLLDGVDVTAQIRMVADGISLSDAGPGIEGTITVETEAGQTSQSFNLPERLYTIPDFWDYSGPPGATILFPSPVLGTVETASFTEAEAPIYALRNAPLDQRFVTVVPANAVTGPFTVESDLGTGITERDFTIVDVPIAIGPRDISFSPPAGPPGTDVIVKGNYVETITAVLVGGVDAPFVDTGADELKLTIPDNAKSGPITVIGLFTSAGISKDVFQVTSPDSPFPPPIITDFQPRTGKAGAFLTIYGLNLKKITAVQFSGTDSPYFYSRPDGNLDVLIPENVITGPVRVVTESGEASLPGDYPITSPAIHSFIPDRAAVGEIVKIYGYFPNINWAGINGVAAPFKIDSMSEMEITVPDKATSGIIVLNASDSQASSGTNQFFVLPQLSSFRPASGFEGRLINVAGTGFLDVTNVAIGDKSLAFQIIGPTNLSVTIPEHAVSGPIRVTTRGGSASTITDFDVLPSVDLVLSFAGPSIVPLGQDALYEFTITNQANLNATELEVRLSLPPALTYNGFTFSSGTTNSESNMLVWSIPELGAHTSTRLAIQAALANRKISIFEGNVTSKELDRNPANNKAAMMVVPDDLPKLSVQKMDGSQMEISWPAASSEFLLQSRRVTSPTWEAVTNAVVIDGEVKKITRPTSNSGELFRLFSAEP